MTVNRNHFNPLYRHFPPWDCPTCSKGHLVSIPKMLLVEETGPSKSLHVHDEWDPDWINERFALLMKCNFAFCGELVAVSGNTSYTEDVFSDEDGQYHQEMARSYEPVSLVPAPMPIRPVEKTPDPVKAALRKAANLLWLNPDSAANQIRQAVELLMNAQKIRKRPKAGGKQLALHGRLLEFEKRDPINGKILRAIKWIGNDGSHIGGVSRDDVLDAFDMMELALSGIYDDAANMIMKKVHAVIKAKEKKPKSNAGSGSVSAGTGTVGSTKTGLASGSAPSKSSSPIGPAKPPPISSS